MVPVYGMDTSKTILSTRLALVTTQPHIQGEPFPPERKWIEQETDHSNPFIAKVKNVCG